MDECREDSFIRNGRLHRFFMRSIEKKMLIKDDIHGDKKLYERYVKHPINFDTKRITKKNACMGSRIKFGFVSS
jgi:hypothetical protein